MNIHQIQNRFQWLKQWFQTLWIEPEYKSLITDQSYSSGPERFPFPAGARVHRRILIREDTIPNRFAARWLPNPFVAPPGDGTRTLTTMISTGSEVQNPALDPFRKESPGFKKAPEMAVFLRASLHTETGFYSGFYPVYFRGPDRGGVFLEIGRGGISTGLQIGPDRFFEERLRVVRPFARMDPMPEIGKDRTILAKDNQKGTLYAFRERVITPVNMIHLCAPEAGKTPSIIGMEQFLKDLLQLEELDHKQTLFLASMSYETIGVEKIDEKETMKKDPPVVVNPLNIGQKNR